MFICTIKFDKKKLVFLVIVAALLLVGMIFLVSALGKAKAQSESAAANGVQAQTQSLTVKSEKARVEWLAQNGWEVESPAESESSVMIPRTFSQVFEDYNELQKQQGFDLSRCCGTEVTMYTYRVTNADPGDEVLIPQPSYVSYLPCTVLADGVPKAIELKEE